MREYMIVLGSVLMIISLSQMLIPEGSIKKFASLAMGFMIIATVVSPLPIGIEKISAEFENFSIDEESIEKNRAQYNAQIMKRHRELLEEKISAHIKHNSHVNVEVTKEGEIISVTINLCGDESAAIFYITNTLKVSRERIKLIYGDN